MVFTRKITVIGNGTVKVTKNGILVGTATETTPFNYSAVIGDIIIRESVGSLIKWCNLQNSCNTDIIVSSTFIATSTPNQEYIYYFNTTTPCNPSYCNFIIIDTKYDEQILTSITLSPVSEVISLSSIQNMTAICKDQYGNLINCPLLNWNSNNPSIANVISTGNNTSKVTGISIGSTNIIASYDTIISNISTISVQSLNVQTHPFMLVKESEYPELQSRTSMSPWKEWKQNAISLNETYDPSVGLERIALMYNIVSKKALAYILDPVNKSTHLTKLKQTLFNWKDLNDNPYGIDGYNMLIHGGTAFFSSVLALDIIYNDLTSTERNIIEYELQRYVNSHSFDPTSTNRPEAYSTISGMWALYKKNESALDIAKYGYKKAITDYVSNDGVFRDGIGYAGARYGASRDIKQHFMDVLEYTGKLSFYSDQKIINFYEWLYGYSTTSFRRYFTFGDTSPIQSNNKLNVHQNGAPIYRAYRFSTQAGKYASWSNNGDTIEHNVDGMPTYGSLLHYLLMRQSFLSPEKAKSRIFWNGGAWFREDNISDNSLDGVLWNINLQGWHSHRDVNAIAISGYGEHILLNSGYGGANEDVLGFTWNYINEQAISGNTVLINGLNHQSESGGMIQEGFTSNKLDYARGNSGTALPNGKHYRNFVFIHPQDGKNGYFILYDEVKANTPGQSVNVILHPNSNTYNTISLNKEYKFIITPNKFTMNNVGVTIFLATTPNVDIDNIKNGVLASAVNSFVGKYIYSTYPTDSSGNKNIVTIIFPHDNTHIKSNIERIINTNYTGAIINNGDEIIDYAIESSGNSTFNYDNVTFHGMETWYRKNNGIISNYFIRQGRIFKNNSSLQYGFETDHNISIHMNNKNGKVIAGSSGYVKIYYPGIYSIKIDGINATVIDYDNTWMNINIPSGTHTININ